MSKENEARKEGNKFKAIFLEHLSVCSGKEAGEWLAYHVGAMYWNLKDAHKEIKKLNRKIDRLKKV